MHSPCKRFSLGVTTQTLLALLLTEGVGAIPNPSPSNKTQGVWTTVAPYQWGAGSSDTTSGLGTHAALLRGAADTSFVLHFHDGVDERIWRAEALTDTFPDAYGAWPVPLNLNNRLFCAGHSFLEDGRLLVVGGTTVQHTGLGRANIFDARNHSPQSNYGWTTTADMAQGRWYPSVTTTASGRIVTLSGDRLYQMFMFGGVDSAGNALNDHRPLNLGQLTSASGTAWWSADAATSSEPSGREGASAVFIGNNGRMYVFGGESAGSYNDELWALVRAFDYRGPRWNWESISTSLPRPVARSRHGAAGEDEMYLMGGKGSGGAVFGDTVWKFTPTSWTSLSATGSGPGSRYGFSMTYVPKRPEIGGVDTSVAQLVVYGGRLPNDALAGDTLWILRLTTTPSWVVKVFSGTPGTDKPVNREGHTATLDRNVRGGARKIVVFGGEGASGVLWDTWVLSRPETGSDIQWSWSKRDPTATPAARTRHSAIHDPEYDRLLIFAGDTNGSAAGGKTNDAWALAIGAGNAEPWQQVTVDSAATVLRRSGHCVVYHTGVVMAQVPERFTMTAGNPPGTWAPLTDGSRLQPFYPHIFLLRSGKLFWAGNSEEIFRDTSFVFDDSTGAWSNPKDSFFPGSCSVMFRPDSILKTGSTLFTPGTGAARAVVDSAGNTEWTQLNPMPTYPRTRHNLTLLPTGQVLMSGGLLAQVDPYVALQGHFVFFPRLWDPTSGWSDSLAKNPVRRQYHSTALLLPDGRVLTAGGPPSRGGATIFWPPYLFNSDGTLATRPVINSVTPCSNHVEYGETFTVDVDTASKIQSVVLLKPGAVTHQLNMDQRYVPLAFATSGDPRKITVAGPITANRAPPGDYLLFVVKSSSGNTTTIPSVAKWVRVGADDVVAPGQTTNLAEYLTGLTFIDVMWTAPGDDAACGQAVRYSVRYKLSPITSANFSSCDTVPKGAPQPAGAEELAHRTGLLPCTTYYFALKTQDEAGNWSAMSNVVAITTECLGEGLMASGSGPNGWTVENTLLGEAQGTEPQTDVYRLKGEWVTSDGKYLLKLSQPDPLKTMLEGVELVAVEHDPKLEAFSGGEKIVLGSRAPASAATSDGDDVRSLVDGTNSTGWVGHPGDTLELRVPGLAADSALLVIESGRRGGSPAESLGIEIRALDAKQGWVTRRQYRPRARFDERLLESLGSERVQLVLHGEYTVRYAGIVSLAAEVPQLEPLTLASAKLGGQDVADLVAPGGTSLAVVNGSEVELAFTVPDGDAEGRDLFLKVRGWWTSLPSVPTLRSRAEGATVPSVFALHPARPNPARGVVRFGFDVPRTARVTLEIFDLQGRRVRTLVRGDRQPGSHSLEWDRRDDSGSRLGPSVYLYRMEAEGFRSRRKLVMLP